MTSVLRDGFENFIKAISLCNYIKQFIELGGWRVCKFQAIFVPNALDDGRHLQLDSGFIEIENHEYYDGFFRNDWTMEKCKTSLLFICVKV